MESLYNNGVYRIDRESLVADAPASDLLEPVLLTDRIANIGRGKLSPDRKGGIWVGTRRTAYFSYLPAGDYTFHIIAAN